MARFRGWPSGKVVMINARAVGAIIAPPAPWIARQTSSMAGLWARPPASDAALNTSSPTTNNSLRPSRSPARPPTSISPPKVIALAVTTHDRPVLLKCRARWMCGRAVITIEASRTTMSWAMAMTARASPRRCWVDSAAGC
jgi:hypothetical protein